MFHCESDQKSLPKGRFSIYHSLQAFNFNSSYAYLARINYLLVKQKIISGDIFGVDCDVSGTVLCKLSNYIENVVRDPHTRYYIETGTQRVTEYIVDSASSFLFSIPLTILNFFNCF